MMTQETEQKRAERQKKAERARLEREEDIRWLMFNRRGRNIFWRLLEETGVFRTSFTGNSETFFKEGERNIGLKFLNDVQILAPEEYLIMLKEHRQAKPDNASGDRAK